jgi:trans-aconitate 2-methyltransferase
MLVMTQPPSSHYTFGDNDLAAARLERLAGAYAGSSAAFLRVALPARVERAIDLGCGIGQSTKLLHDLTQGSLVVGYERSAKYLQYARRCHPTLRFREIDVLLPSYPDRDVDVIYSRFLLTHLHTPRAAMATCLEHLRPGGRLLLEETSNLTSPIPILQTYYAMVGEMQAHYGQELYIGLRLQALADTLPCARVSIVQTPIQIPTNVMARLHAMNIGTWKRDPHMLQTHGLAALERLQSALDDLACSNRTDSAVTSLMAQVVVERT